MPIPKQVHTAQDGTRSPPWESLQKTGQVLSWSLALISSLQTQGLLLGTHFPTSQWTLQAKAGRHISYLPGAWICRFLSHLPSFCGSLVNVQGKKPVRLLSRKDFSVSVNRWLVTTMKDRWLCRQREGAQAGLCVVGYGVSSILNVWKSPYGARSSTPYCSFQTMLGWGCSSSGSWAEAGRRCWCTEA